MRSSILSLLLLAGVTLADFSNVTTVTNYITPVCFQSALSEILPAELGAPQSTGIEVVFVYEEAGALAASESDSNPHATNVVGASYTTSDLTYTIRTSSVATATITTCTDGYCSVYQSQSTIPTSYEMSTKVTYLTTFTGEGTETKTTEIPKISSTKSNTSGESSTTTSPEATTKPSTITEKSSSKENTSTVTKKERSTIYETDKITQDLTTTVKITKSAPTTTTTLFSASTIISYNNNTVTTSETITQTASDPLITKSAVPTSKNVTIAVDSITKAVSFTTSSAPSNSSITTKLFSNSSVASVSPSSTHSIATLETYLASNVSSHVNSTSFAGYNTSSSILPVSYSTIISNSSTIVSTYLATSTESIATTTTTPESSAESETATTLVTSETLSSSSSKTSTSTSASTSASAAASDTSSSNGYTGDLFTAISTESPPSVFSRADLPLAIPSGVSTESPIGTNKFYANLFLGAQTDMVWTAPYGGFWKTSDYYGFAVQHTDPNSRVFGTSNTNNEDVYSYYLNPTNLGELIISSTTLSSSSNNMFVTNMNEMSATVQLTSDSTLGSNYIEIPLVQGMGFVTSIYHGSTTAVINSLVGVKTLTQETSSALNANTLKFRATLESGNDWLIYVTDPSKSKTKRAFKRSFDFSFDASNPYKLIGSSSIDGLIIQYAFAPSDLTKDAYYDEAAGCYATSASVTGSVSLGTSATYLFKYTVSGSSSSGKTIVFALPHHVASVTSTTANANTGITLYSTTKGEMVGFLTNELSFAEELTTDIQFLPWSLMMTGSISYTADQLKLLAEAANDELSVDISLTVAGMDSNYFSGKVIDKYAYILLVVNDIIGDETVAKSTLADLKEAFAPFIANKQYYPLMYDTRWLGVTSTASQNGDTGADYGSGYYNDHHFHYGYFVHAAAVVGYIDKKYGGTWAEDNKDWVNSLIRDVANPSSDDTYFPVSRMFDWFGGHSWAAGLFASGDGKNQESSSEDYNFSYGMKLWGKVIGDEAMESRGDLMLAIQKRAMNLYMYYTDDNTVEPSGFIGNKVSGILYENKIAYTTFFGSPDVHPEYVHGIHMMPITPASSLIRGPTYVKQEWTDQVSTFINNVDSGWTGVLKLNQALYDASTSYEFFSSDSWTDTYLDNGQSRTWALAYSGGIQNAT